MENFRVNINSFPHSWGWSAFFESQTGEVKPDWKIARVVNQEKGLYKIQISDGQSQWAQLSGKLKHEIQDPLAYPAVGDWLFYTHATGDERALIHQLLPRRSCFYRGADQVVASNIDTVFIVSSANSEMNLNRLDRYLSIAWDSGATPVIVLSKTDLCENPEEMIAEIEERHLGVTVIPVTMSDATSLEKLNAYLKPAATVVLLGSSGVGKSTLTNALLGVEIADTGALSIDDKRGRHTTTSRQLYRLPEGALLMDTPGMRSLALGNHEEGLQHQFAAITEIISRCRFGDCQHQTEPGCAVIEAFEKDEIDPDQWQSYLKLQKEVFHQKMKEDRVLLEQQRNKWKKVTKDLRVRNKLKSRGEL
jgi:ribosome biogenesis GTPase